MSITTLFQLYPDECFALCLAGFFSASVLNLVSLAVDDLVRTAEARFMAARCAQFGNLHIDGWCSGHGCPVREHCCYHSGSVRPTLRDFFSRFAAKLKKKP